MVLIQTTEKNSGNSFEKDLFKPINNSTFGKTMENIRKRINIRQVNNARDYNKYISKPSFVSQKIFSENFVVIHEIKPVLTLDKPIYVGFSILNLSKLLMYEFHDKCIKNIMPSCCLQTLTLQFMKLKHDVYEDFYEDKYLFDFSDYPRDSRFFDLVNKKVIDKMKDEFKVEIINEFIGLKSEMCSLVSVDGKENKKSKRSQ